MIKTTPPTVAAEPKTPILSFKSMKLDVIGTTEPRTKFGTVVATVARILVPNCSAAIVINSAQYPQNIPNKKTAK